jgi:mycothiol synthase
VTPIQLRDQHYSVRPANMDDAEAVTALLNAVLLHDEGRADGWRVDSIRNEWSAPSFDIAQNTRVILNEDEQIVAYVEAWTKPIERCIVWGHVHPDYLGQGLGSYIMGWGEARAQAALVEDNNDSRVVIHTFSLAEKAAASDLFLARGYTPVRNSYTMRIDMTEAPQEVALPEGYHIRPMRYPDDLREMMAVILTSFKDHWGYVHHDLDEIVAEERHELDNDPLFNPEYYRMIVDADGKIAALANNRLEDWDDPTVAHLHVLAVLPEHRRKGLGYAALVHSLKLMYDVGRPNVTLSVDAKNLTGALRLYERAGMHPVQTRTTYEKEIRAGRDTMTRTVEQEKDSNE